MTKETEMLLYGLGLPEEVAKDLIPTEADPILTEKRIKQQKFLHAFIETCGMVNKAASQAGVDPTTTRYWRKTDPVFAEAYEVAKMETIALLEEEVVRRAYVGVDRNVYHKGQIVDTVKDLSDLLLMFYLKKLDPSYRENATANIGIMGQDFTIQFVDPDTLEKKKPTLISD